MINIFVIGGYPHSDRRVKYRRDHLLFGMAGFRKDIHFYYLCASDGKSEKPSFIMQERLGENITRIVIDDDGYFYSNYIPSLALISFIKSKSEANSRSILLFTLPHFYYLPLFLPGFDVYYDCSDNWPAQFYNVGVISFLKKKFMTYKERYIVARSKLVTCSSKILVERVSRYARVPVFYYRHGVDLKQGLEPLRDNFRKSNDNDFLRFVFVGSLKNEDELKIDVRFIHDLLDREPTISIDIFGPISDFPNPSIKNLIQRERVHYRGIIDNSDVINKISFYDFGLLPYKINEFTSGVFPLKTFEYFSADLGVVSTCLPSLIADEEISKYINFSCDGSLPELINDKDSIKLIVEGNTWDQLAARYLDVLGV